MKIYCLEPVPGSETHPNWKTSTLEPTRAWVQADSPDDARRKLHLNTWIAVETPGLSSPWKDETLTECKEDRPGFQVPEGIIVSSYGTITVQKL
jgi:hypothetical protein